jgi:uncharacterized alpha-E superfamily protein
MTSVSIAEFMILDSRFPRSLYSASRVTELNLGYLAKDYDARKPSHDLIDAQLAKLRAHTIESIFEDGLHQFIAGFIRDNNAIGIQIEQDYQFNG